MSCYSPFVSKNSILSAYLVPIATLLSMGMYVGCADPVGFDSADQNQSKTNGGKAASIVYNCMNATLTSAGTKWSYHVPQIMNLMNSVTLKVTKSESKQPGQSPVSEVIGSFNLNKVGTDRFSDNNLTVTLKQLAQKKSIVVQHGSLGITARAENGWCKSSTRSVPQSNPSTPSRPSTSTSPSNVTFEGTKQVSIGATQATELSPKIRAFLDMIAAAEGTSIMNNPCGQADYGYASLFECYRYESRRFHSYADHPRQFFTTSWGSSTDASGRYQFQARTWDEVARQEGLSDFSPANQDRGVVNRLKSRGSYRFISQIQIGSSPNYAFKQALDASACEWASLPAISGSANHKRTVGGMPSCYGQITHKAEDLYGVFVSAYYKYAR